MKFNLNLILISLLAMGVIMSGCGGEKKEETKAAAPAELHISAAASMTDAMKEIADNYQKKNPNIKLVLNFGSSGALQRAIEQGAPADIFISAAVNHMNELEKKDYIKQWIINKIFKNQNRLVDCNFYMLLSIIEVHEIMMPKRWYS